MVNPISFGQSYKFWFQNPEHKEILSYTLPAGKTLDGQEPDTLLFVPQSDWNMYVDIAASMAKAKNVPVKDYLNYIDDKVDTFVRNSEPNALSVFV